MQGVTHFWLLFTHEQLSFRWMSEAANWSYPTILLANQDLALRAWNMRCATAIVASWIDKSQPLAILADLLASDKACCWRLQQFQWMELSWGESALRPLQPQACCWRGTALFGLSTPKLAAGGYNNFGERSYHEGKALFDRKYDGQQIGWRIKGGSITGKNNRDNRSGLIGKKMDAFEKN